MEQATTEIESHLQFELRADGVLIVRPQGPLKREDFDNLAHIVDPWIKDHGELKGIVVHTKKFPGWENFGGFIHHMDFIEGHHRKVRKVALAADGILPTVMSAMARYFIKAEIKHFPYHQEESAIAWAKS